MSQKPSSFLGHHAVVIGGSIAGLLASRILVQYFEHVTLLERDALDPEHPHIRPGVPQSNHVHVLLTQGQRILEDLFPGIQAELTALGAPTVNWTAECLLFLANGWQPRIPSDLNTRTCTRNLLEWAVRRRLMAYPNFKIQDNCPVKNLLANETNTQITGVALQNRNNNETQNLKADFVVDASGRNSALPKWLEKLGYEPPQEKIVNSFLGYSTRWYQMPEGFTADWKAAVIQPQHPTRKRGGVIYPVENNCWGIILSAIAKDYPPTDEAGYIEFARSLPNPLFYDLINSSKPLSPIYGYRRTENRLCHYEKLSKMPDGIVALGDAVCAFNPVYGQGMTTAAFGALTLDECLQSRTLKGITRKFQKRLAKVIQTPWMMATSEDCRWDTTEGGTLDPMTRLMHRYMDQIVQLGVYDQETQKTFAEVIHFIQSPDVFFQPKYLLKVLKQVVNRKALRQVNVSQQTQPNLLS